MQTKPNYLRNNVESATNERNTPSDQHRQSNAGVDVSAAHMSDRPHDSRHSEAEAEGDASHIAAWNARSHSNEDEEQRAEKLSDQSSPKIWAANVIDAGTNAQTLQQVVFIDQLIAFVRLGSFRGHSGWVEEEEEVR